MGGYFGYIILTVIISVVGGIISARLKSKFKKYSKVPLASGLSGAEIALKMLDHYGISDVKITEGKGFLSDHYNPNTKTVSLSPAVFQGRSVASAAVAAHEVGHAVQHDTSYAMLTLRSKLVPVVQFASVTQQYLLMAVLLFASTNPSLLFLTIIAFGATTLFAFITLPVEFDASNRALAYIDSTGIVQGAEYDGAQDALKWAAMTYVAAALSSLIILIFLVLRFMGD